VERWEGALFVALYIAYIAHMILAAAQSPALITYANVMTALIVVIVIALAALSIRQLRRDRAAPVD
jgi:cation:H+ antiporter